MRNYKKLEVCKIEREINKGVSSLMREFSKEEIFALINQMRRAFIGVILNIVEGYIRDSMKEFVHYLRISARSVKELECQFYVALDIGYIKKNDFDYIMEELDRLGRSSGVILNIWGIIYERAYLEN